MAPERFLRLQELFEQALELPTEQREAWCGEAAGDDLELREELMRLLRNDARLAGAPVPSAVAVGAAALEDISDGLRMPGRRVGRYELHEELGRGGMGRVFRATRDEPGMTQEVALKLVRRDVLSEPVLRRFLAERRVLAGLNHPGIARLLDAGEAADGTPFVAMELVRGLPLPEHCAAHGLGLEARLALFRQVLAAVSHAHRNLIVHRDIKPANVLVDAEGRARLLDFGIAKPLAAADETVTCERYFTPAYAAPEQLRGEPASVALDVYALGALLYEVLAGRPAFRQGNGTAAQLQRLIETTPPPPLDAAADATAAQRLGVRDPAAWRRRLRGELDCIVQRALRKEAAARYASVEQFDEDIASFLAQRPVRAAGSQRGYRLRKFLARNRAVAGVAAVAAIGLLLAMGLVLRQAEVARLERDRAQAALAVLQESFKAADPMQVSGGALEAGQVLDAAGRHVDALADVHPQLHAELAAELGDVRLALGMADAGGPAMQRALAWAASPEGDDGLLHRLQLLDARRRVAAHDYAAADAALAALEARAPDDPDVLSVRAHYWLVQDDAARALPFAQRALAALEDARDGLSHAQAAWQLAEAQRLAGQVETARATLDALLAQQQAALGADHPRTLVTRLRRIDVLLQQEQAGPAAQEAAGLIGRLEPVFGPDSSMLALAQVAHAGALTATGRYAESAAAWESASAAYAASLGTGHENTYRTRFNAAQMLAYVEADATRVDPQFEGAIEGATRARSPNDPLVTFFRSEYARMRAKRGELDAARAVLLPDVHEPDLERLSNDNLGPLRDQLVELFGPFDCAAPSAQDAVRERAARIACDIEARLRAPSASPLAVTTESKP